MSIIIDQYHRLQIPSILADAQTHPRIPTPADIGLTSLLDPDESPQTALKPLLHSFLHTLLLLIDVLTSSARPPHELAERGWGHEGDQVGRSDLSARHLLKYSTFNT